MASKKFFGMKDIKEELMRELRGIAKRLKRMGPRTEPCRTPQVIGDGEKDEVEWQRQMCEMASMR